MSQGLQCTVVDRMRNNAKHHFPHLTMEEESVVASRSRTVTQVRCRRCNDLAQKCRSGPSSNPGISALARYEAAAEMVQDTDKFDATLRVTQRWLVGMQG